MSFRKIDTKEEIKNAIKKKPELEKYIRESDLKYELIKSIVTYRKEHGITQEQISKKSRLTQQMVSRIEKFTYSPSLDTFIRYLDAMGLGLTFKKQKENL
ncbi:helix-turn-helix domain-containing protein [Clostridium sp. MT-14]|uniref:helix-turn-helix domain-containing protein n=1 Tax=Clostridium sp. MT-14 TaxID=3348360 RepID=UPI0035F29A44